MLELSWQAQSATESQAFLPNLMMKRRSKAPISIGAAEARSNFGQIIRRASGKDPDRFVIGVRGEPKVVVIGLDDYNSLVAAPPAIMAEIHAHSKMNGTDELTMEEIDAEIEAFRRERRELNGGSVRCS
jgi:prevent-host-death family protein